MKTIVLLVFASVVSLVLASAARTAVDAASSSLPTFVLGVGG